MKRAIELMRNLLDAYDQFMLSDLDTHITNEAWLNLTNAIHAIRIFIHEYK